ncbi:TPA: conserved hypothetical protein [Aquificae Joseph's Coat Spring virus]|nr:TPA: conserved hypothetical protein [Aquificae Joseph's Coat Spring virus]
MDEELQKLLDELQKLTEGQVEQPKQEQVSQSQPQPPPQSNNAQSQTTNNVENQVKAWKEIGIVRFTAKYGNLPKFSQILQMVIPKADQKVLKDAQTNSVKSEYFDYLEEAYNETIKEIASFTKELFSRPVNQSQPNQKPSEPEYSMQQYYNDYKRMLEDMTAKEIATIEFRDGIMEDGKVRSVGIPRASIDQPINLRVN